MSVERVGWVAIVATAAVCVATVSLVLAKIWPKDAGDVASWVQAIGSIAAILGAFAVGQMQARASLAQAIRLRELEQNGRREAVRAVVESASQHAASMGESAAKMSLFALQGYWKIVGREQHDAVIMALDGLPLHELSSAQRVLAVTGMRAAMVRMRTHFGEVMAMENSQFLGLGHQQKSQQIVAEAAFVAHFWKTFESA